jgi:hypothetical protein
MLLPANGAQGMQQQRQQVTPLLMPVPMAQPQLQTANSSQSSVLLQQQAASTMQHQQQWGANNLQHQQQQAANMMLQQQQAASCSSMQLQPPALPAAGSPYVQLAPAAAAQMTAAEPWGMNNNGMVMPGVLSRSISSASSDASCCLPHAAGSAGPAALPIAVPAMSINASTNTSGEAPFVVSQQQMSALQQQQEQRALMRAQQQMIALQQQQLQDMMQSQQQMTALQQQLQQNQAMLLSKQQMAPLAPPQQQMAQLQQQQLSLQQQQQQLAPQLLAAPLQPQPGVLCSATGAQAMQLSAQGVVGQHMPAGTLVPDVQYEPAAWQQQQLLQQGAVAAGPACLPSVQQWQPTDDPPVQMPHPRVVSACMALSHLPPGTFVRW